MRRYSRHWHHAYVRWPTASRSFPASKSGRWTPALALLHADGQQIFPGVQVRFVPGHTPGHAIYVITSGGRRLVAFGDAMHSPIQIAHPEWSAAPDHDARQAAEFRGRLVAELAEPGTIGFGIHFADVVFGQVRHSRDGSPYWQPVDA